MKYTAANHPRPHAPPLVVLGDINVDILGRLEAPPRMGSDCLAPDLKFSCGGVAVNSSFTLARCGVPVRLVGCTGADWFADFVLGVLRREGINVDFVQRAPDQVTGLVFVAVAPDGQRTMFGSRGANQHLQPLAPPDLILKDAAALHLVGYNFLCPGSAHLAQDLLKNARRSGLRVTLDAGMAPSLQISTTLWQLAKQVDIFFASADESMNLTGHQEPEKAFGALEQGGIPNVVLKLGERGCLFREAERLRRAPSFQVPVVDTTGAGDAFTAAFLYAEGLGWTRAEAAFLANAAGAAAASILGAGENLPGPHELLRVLAEGRLAEDWDPVRQRIYEKLRREHSLAPSGHL